MNSTHVDPQSNLGCDPYKVRVLKEAIRREILSDDTPIALFYDMTRFGRAIDDVLEAFPQEHFLHTMAIKTNPVAGCLEFAKEKGLGFEAASLGELREALQTGASPQNCVFDSPAKRIADIKFALNQGVYLNLDNMQEVYRCAEIIENGDFPHCRVGIRVNPQVGVGVIKEMSTAGKVSKFGVAFGDYCDELLEVYERYEWLNGIHVHVGSQGTPLSLMAQGAKKIFELVEMINDTCGRQQITWVDIGGGLSVNFDSEEDYTESMPGPAAYATLLRKTVPEVFSGKYTILTEFGRRYNAKPGFVVSRAEYTKQSGGKHIAIVHCGADLLVRTIYCPKQWALRVSVMDKDGNKKAADTEVQDVAGPCCFSGDYVCRDRELPRIDQGDWVVCHDTGGHTMGSFSFFNSRLPPPVYGVFQTNPTSDDTNGITERRGMVFEEFVGAPDPDTLLKMYGYTNQPRKKL